MLIAQNSVTWVGGTLGNPTSWEEPKNWSNHHVPNEFSDVIIPDVSTTTFSSPVISTGKVELNSLKLTPSTKLTIEKPAQLIVFGRTEGLVNENVEILGSFLVWDAIEEKAIDVKISFSKN
jgi:hypothetical protein